MGKSTWAWFLSSMSQTFKFPTVANKRDWADFRWLYLVNDTLHVGFVRLVSIQQWRPLVRCNAQTCLHGYLNYLGIVFPSQSFVSPKFLLQLHQGGILISLGHLARRSEPNTIKQDKPKITWSPKQVNVFKSVTKSFSQTKINYDTTQWTTSSC